MKWHEVVLGGLCLLAAGCTKVTPPDGHLKPNKIGDTWKYVGWIEVDGKKHDLDLTSTVTGERKTPPGKTAQVMTMTTHYPDRQKTIEDTELTYNDAAGSEILCGKIDKDGTVHWVDNAQHEVARLQSPLVVGQENDCHYALDDGTIRDIKRKVDGVESVDVKAGSFVVFRMTTVMWESTRDEPALFETHSTEWYAPRQGIIKLDSTHQRDKKSTTRLHMELVSSSTMK